MDLIFVGMPVLQYFDISSNLLSQINLNNVSVNSNNVMAKAKILVQNNSLYFDTFIKSFYQQQTFPYLMNFTNNNLTNVVFNFIQLHTLVNSVIPVESVYLLQKLASINLSPNNLIQCDCGIFDDFNFILNGPYNSSIKPVNLNTSNLAKTNCKHAEISYNIYSLVSINDLTLANQICSIISSSCGAFYSHSLFTLILIVFNGFI